jgi:hypothetical protein
LKRGKLRVRALLEGLSQLLESGLGFSRSPAFGFQRALVFFVNLTNLLSEPALAGFALFELGLEAERSLFCISGLVAEAGLEPQEAVFPVGTLPLELRGEIGLGALERVVLIPTLLGAGLDFAQKCLRLLARGSVKGAPAPVPLVEKLKLGFQF